MKTPQVLYEHSVTKSGTIDFFPIGFDKSDLIDVSQICNKFSVYLYKSSTGMVDCKHFYDQYIDSLEDEQNEH